MTFLQNPFQKKYLPVLISVALGVAALALTHAPFNLFVMLVLAAFQYVNADRPLTRFYFSGYVVLASLFSAFAIYSLFVGVFAAAAVSGAVALLPLSILFTRKIA